MFDPVDVRLADAEMQADEIVIGRRVLLREAAAADLLGLGPEIEDRADGVGALDFSLTGDDREWPALLGRGELEGLFAGGLGAFELLAQQQRDARRDRHHRQRLEDERDPGKEGQNHQSIPHWLNGSSSGILGWALQLARLLNFVWHVATRPLQPG